MCMYVCNILIGKGEEEEGETLYPFLFHLPHSPLSPCAPVPPSSLLLQPFVSLLHVDVPPHAVYMYMYEQTIYCTIPSSIHSWSDVNHSTRYAQSILPHAGNK